jgi:hypothetical protein
MGRFKRAAVAVNNESNLAFVEYRYIAGCTSCSAVRKRAKSACNSSGDNVWPGWFKPGFAGLVVVWLRVVRVAKNRNKKRRGLMFIAVVFCF